MEDLQDLDVAPAESDSFCVLARGLTSMSGKVRGEAVAKLTQFAFLIAENSATRRRRYLSVESIVFSDGKPASANGTAGGIAPVRPRNTVLDLLIDGSTEPPTYVLHDGAGRQVRDIPIDPKLRFASRTLFDPLIASVNPVPVIARRGLSIEWQRFSRKLLHGYAPRGSGHAVRFVFPDKNTLIESEATTGTYKDILFANDVPVLTEHSTGPVPAHMSVDSRRISSRTRTEWKEFPPSFVRPSKLRAVRISDRNPSEVEAEFVWLFNERVDDTVFDASSVGELHFGIFSDHFD
ncbi:hypothetical protein Mal65_26280 [Crateriforma conspicua]|nr:hypothetical protein Mal65_26280 [Crateriforma conspicua]